MTGSLYGKNMFGDDTVGDQSVPGEYRDFENPWHGWEREEKKGGIPCIELFDSRSPLIILIHRTYVLLPKRGPLIHHISSVSRGQPVIYHKI